MGTALAVSSGSCLQSDGVRSVSAGDGCFQSAAVVVETQAVVAGAAGDGCLVLSAVGGQVDGVIAFAAVHLQLRIGGGNAVSIVRLGAGDLRHRVGNGNLLFQAHIDAVKHNPDALDIDVAVNDHIAC